MRLGRWAGVRRRQHTAHPRTSTSAPDRRSVTRRSIVAIAQLPLLLYQWAEPVIMHAAAAHGGQR